MIILKKNKIKNSLIDDFIQISLISNFCCSVETLKIQNSLLKENIYLILRLKKRYLALIEKLKLNDNSFNILVRDLNTNNNLFEKEKKSNFHHIEETLAEIKKVLIRISMELESKLKLFT